MSNPSDFVRGTVVLEAGHCCCELRHVPVWKSMGMTAPSRWTVESAFMEDLFSTFVFCASARCALSLAEEEGADRVSTMGSG